MDDNYIKPYTLKSIFKLALMPIAGEGNFGLFYGITLFDKPIKKSKKHPLKNAVASQETKDR